MELIDSNVSLNARSVEGENTLVERGHVLFIARPHSSLGELNSGKERDVVELVQKKDQHSERRPSFPSPTFLSTEPFPSHGLHLFSPVGSWTWNAVHPIHFVGRRLAGVSAPADTRHRDSSGTQASS